MPTYVKGNAVANATKYELYEKKVSGTYEYVSQASEINFEVSALGLSAGDHMFVVKAKADGYEDSDYSDHVTYTVAESGGDEPVTPTNYTFTINPTPSSATVTLTASGYTQSGNSITVPSGTNVSWKVTASGYEEQSGTENVTSTSTKNVTLVEESGGVDSGTVYNDFEYITGQYLDQYSGNLNTTKPEWNYCPTYFEVTPGQVITFEGCSSTGQMVIYYDSSKTRISHGQGSLTYTVPAGAVYMRFNMHQNYLDTASFQLK